MSKFLLFFLIWILFPHIGSAQTYTFYGVLKLEGTQQELIPYKLVFSESNEKINGYSVTDFRGENETENIITGTYNDKTKVLSVKEKDIIYTKSPVSENLFCFVNFHSKIKLTNKKAYINTNFNGLFKNGKKCIDGKVMMIGTGTVFKLLNKVNNKIQKSKKLDDQQKQQYNVYHLFDSLQTQNLSDKQDLTVFVDTDSITFVIWDSDVEDGDEINFYQNGKVILPNYIVQKAKKYLHIKLDKRKNVFKIEALNQGTQGLNTAMVNIIGDNSVKFLTNLKTGQSTSVTILRK